MYTDFVIIHSIGQNCVKLKISLFLSPQLCEICQEQFEMYWEEEEEEWHLKNAIRVDEKVRNPLIKRAGQMLWLWCLRKRLNYFLFSFRHTIPHVTKTTKM